MAIFTLLEEEEKKNKFTLLEEPKFTLLEEEKPVLGPLKKIEGEQMFTLLEEPVIPDYSTTQLAQQLKEVGYVPQYDSKPELTLKDIGKAGVKGFETGAFLGYTPLFEEYQPDTALEKGLYYSSALAGFILPATLITKFVGFGFGGAMRLVPTLSKIPTGVRVVGLSTATGGILGALKKPVGKETRLKAAVTTGVLFGAFSAVGLGAQKILAKRGITRLNKLLDKSDELAKAADVNLSVSNKLVLQNPRVQKVLSGLRGGDKTVVINIVKGRQGLPIELRQNWYEKHIGAPIYNKLTTALDKWNWAPANWIKKQLVYRYGQPKEWAEAAEKRLVDIAVGRDKSRAIGQLLTDKLNKAEVNEILSTLGRNEPNLFGKLMRDKPLSRAESMRVMQIMKGSITAGARPDLAARAQIAREEIDSLSNELIKLPIPEETKQIITNNLGTYVRRFYTTKEGGNLFSRIFAPFRLKGRTTFLKEKARSLKEAFRKDILKEQNIINKNLKTFNIGKIKGIGGITKTRLNRARYRTISDLESATSEDLIKVTGIGEKAANEIIIQAKVTGHTMRAMQSRLRFLDFRLTKDITRVDFPSEVRRTLGEITEAGYPTVRTMNGMINDIETSRLFDFASTNPNLSTSDAAVAMQKGWIKLANLDSLGRLKGKFVPQSVADDVQYIQNIANKSESLYLKMLSMWKFAKVPMNPATHCRNLMSNTMLLDASGTPLTRQPSLISTALEEMQTKGRFFQMAKRAGAFGGEFSEVEITSMLNNWNATSGSSGLERIIEFSGKKLGFKSLARLYQAEEQLFKLAKFIDMIGYQGATPSMAAIEAQKWLFNYNKIPAAVNTIKNAWWGSPFITFQYKVFPRMAESLIKRPLALAKYPLVFNAMEQYAINKYKLTDKEVALAKKRAPWNFNLPLSNFKYILPFKDRNNNLRVIDMGFTFPFGEVGEVGSFGNIMGFLNGPVPKVAPVITPLITGQPYTEPAFQRKLKTTKEKVTYLAEQLLPPLAGYSGRKVKAAAEGRTDYYGTPYDYWLEVMRNVFGIKTTAFVTDIANYKLYRQMEGSKRDISIEINRIGKDRSLTTEEKQKKIEEEVNRYKKEMTDVMEEFRLR